MQPEFIELSRYRLQKAKDDYKAAILLLSEGMYPQSLNRSYYAIFHATRALLALDSFDSGKHSGIIAYFNKQYVATGIFEKEFSKILMKAVSSMVIRAAPDAPTCFRIARRASPARAFLDALRDFKAFF